MIEWLFAILFGAWLGAASPEPVAPAGGVATKPVPADSSDLNRIAFAIEGAESSHGRDPLMWQPHSQGPQGPMQVTRRAALDVGGGNRFDANENRRIGRAYLAALHQRYGNWADAVAAYNWGPGNLDRWIAAGRPVQGVSAAIQAYIHRVMREFAGASTSGAVPTPAQPPPPEIKDRARRKAFERNAAAISQIRGFLDGDGSSADNVLAAIRSTSARPGYEEFKISRPTVRHPPSAAALRDIARVLLGKLQSENAAIVLVDERHGERQSQGRYTDAASLKGGPAREAR